MKIFEGQSIESLSWQELSQLRYSVNEWYFPVSAVVPNVQKDRVLVDYTTVKGHLDHMLHTSWTDPDGNVMGTFSEYELPDGSFVYTVLDGRGNVWMVYQVARTFRSVRRPLDSGEEFVAEQWASVEENAS